MDSDPTTGFTRRANGEKAPGGVSASGRSCRHQSESESDGGPAVRSLARLCSRDEEERAAALEELSQGVLVGLGLDRHGSARLSKQTLLHLLRLSRSCPLQDVRGRATELLRTAQVMLRYYTYRYFILITSADLQEHGGGCTGGNIHQKLQICY